MRFPSPIMGKGLFSGDERLRRYITLTQSSNTYGLVLRKLSTAVGAKFALGENAREFEKAGILTLCAETPVYNLMDAMASLSLTIWTKPNKDTYLLIPSNRSRDFVFSARNEHRQRRNQLGVAFAGSARRLPLQQQAMLFSEPGIGYSSLPKDMQQHIKGMVESRNGEYAGKFEPWYAGHLSMASVYLTHRRVEDFNTYKLHIKMPNVNGGFSITDYDEVKRKREVVERRNGSGDRYTPEKFEISLKKARTLPALQKTVEIHARNITLPDVMKQLHDRYSLSVVSETRESIPQRANVEIARAPLSDVLDRLTEIYADTEWEYRKYGFLIIRGPKNPARDPSKGQANRSSAD